MPEAGDNQNDPVNDITQYSDHKRNSEIAVSRTWSRYRRKGEGEYEQADGVDENKSRCRKLFRACFKQRNVKECFEKMLQCSVTIQVCPTHIIAR